MPINFGTLSSGEQALWGTQVHNALSDLPEEFKRILQPLAQAGMGPNEIGAMLSKIMDEQQQAAKLEETGRQANQKEAGDIFKTQQVTNAQRDVALGNVLGGKYSGRVDAAQVTGQNTMLRDILKQQAIDQRSAADRTSREGIAAGNQALGKERLDIMRNPPMKLDLKPEVLGPARQTLVQLFEMQTGQQFPPEQIPMMDQLVPSYLAYKQQVARTGNLGGGFNVGQALAQLGWTPPEKKPGLFGK
jgi:hypothetical protein